MKDLLNNFHIKFLPGLLFLLTFARPILPQAIANEERNYNYLNTLLIELQQEYDSLLVHYENETRLINEAKANNSDETESLLAKAVVTSNRLEQIQSEILHTNEKIEASRKQLYALYSTQIDSLRMLENIDSLDGSSERLNFNILSLIQKRFSVTAQTKVLSYFPEELLKINLMEPTDSSEVKIYSDYLTSAIAEIDSQIINTNNQIEKLEEMQNLQSKVDQFISDIEFENASDRLFTQSGSYPLTGPEGNKARNDYGQTNMDIASNSLRLHNQLSLFSSNIAQGDLNTMDAIDFESFTQQDYYNLLVELNSRLTNYKEALQNILNKNE